ncbi:MAG: hypothetical protein ACTSYD_03135 [Candidatus Heimdallarchaeaceae archaeon]
MNSKTIETEISTIIENEGFGSKLLKMIRESKEQLSPTFITDVLVENINLYIDYDVLLEFLPAVWKTNNESLGLLGYIAGIAHHVFYLAKDYPLGKELPEYLAKKIEKTYQVLAEFRKKNIEIKVISVENNEIDDFNELVDWLKTFPRYPVKIKESVDILAVLFKTYVSKFPQKFQDEDAVAMFTSRCLIFWKMEALTDEELKLCLEKMIEKIDRNVQIENIVRILPLEMLNYPFLQLGFTKKMIDKVAEIIIKQYNKNSS